MKLLSAEDPSSYTLRLTAKPEHRIFLASWKGIKHSSFTKASCGISMKFRPYSMCAEIDDTQKSFKCCLLHTDDGVFQVVCLHSYDLLDPRHTQNHLWNDCSRYALLPSYYERALGPPQCPLPMDAEDPVFRLSDSALPHTCVLHVSFSLPLPFI